MKCLTLDEVKQLAKRSYKECKANGNVMTADNLLLTIILNIKEQEDEQH
jgi:hypothetical protein